MDGTTINEKPFSDPITLWRSSIGTRWRGGEKDRIPQIRPTTGPAESML